MNINFEYYKVFYVIAKNKNITKAAHELNISQPAISRMLKTMEEQMNIKLFIRKTKGVILTNEGKELYRLIANNIDNIMKSEISFSKIIKNKAIKIAGNKTYINYLIENKKLDSIFNTNSNINLIDTNSFDLLNNQLSNNLIDFAFISEPTNYQFNSELVFKQLEEFHLVYFSNNENNKPNNYHINKTIACEKKGIRLIHIFEDEWLNKQNIWKSIIKNLLFCEKNRIFARKCILKEVNYQESMLFLINNHQIINIYYYN